MIMNLRDYQQRALLYCMRVRNPALFMDMRLGKTRIIIKRILQLNIKTVLIICPYSAFKGWKDELYKFGENQHGIITLIEDKWKRYSSLKKFFTNKWFIASIECHRVIEKLYKFKWDVVVLDESHFIKNPNRSSNYYANNFRDVPYRFISTGTPAEESELEYFLQLQFLDPKILDENNYYVFRNKFFTKDIDHKYIITHTGERYLTGRLAKYCFFLSRKDVKLGGKKVYIQRYVKLTNEMKKIYNDTARNFILEYGEKELMTMYAPVKWLWLRQICGGFIDGEYVYKGKVEELIKLLLIDLKDQQVVIWCQYIQEITMLYRVLSKQWKTGAIYGKIKPIMREDIQEKFLQGKLKYLICQPGCFRHGVDLSSASAEIYYTSPSSGEIRKQSEDRTINLEKQDSVLIIDLIVDKTIEEDIYISLIRKESRSDMTKRIIKRIQNES